MLSDFRVAGLSRVNPLRPLRNPGLKLSWKDNFFDFEFSSANFFSPGKIEYAYQLVGFDPHGSWQARRVEGPIPTCPPWKIPVIDPVGAQRAMEPTGIPVESGHRASFLADLVVFAVAPCRGRQHRMGMYRWRVAQIRKEERMKAGFQRRIAEVEMSALRAQMNPHFIFNCLNSINRFILVNEPDAASDYLTKFSRLIRLILDHSRTERILSRPRTDALRLYIELKRCGLTINLRTRSTWRRRWFPNRSTFRRCSFSPM
ncbi:MAG: histidine kinase [Haliscomenobacter sp.]|nr:histidine kinase [Haliscomenobacter sp.]